jgi:hypothetical protein
LGTTLNSTITKKSLKFKNIWYFYRMRSITRKQNATLFSLGWEHAYWTNSDFHTCTFVDEWSWDHHEWILMRGQICKYEIHK